MKNIDFYKIRCGMSPMQDLAIQQRSLRIVANFQSLTEVYNDVRASLGMHFKQQGGHSNRTRSGSSQKNGDGWGYLESPWGGSPLRDGEGFLDRLVIQRFESGDGHGDAEAYDCGGDMVVAIGINYPTEEIAIHNESTSYAQCTFKGFASSG